MGTAIAIAVAVFIIGAILYWMYSQGKKTERLKQVEQINEVKEKQLEIAIRPDTPADVVDRLRKHEF